MDPLRVLVTGAGSAVGQGIIKALRIGKIPVSIVSSDIDSMNAALFRADDAVLIPKVEENGTLPIIIDRLLRKKIQCVMIGSEFDIEFFSTHRETIQRETGAQIIVSPIETVRIADDKWLTAEFLRKNNLPYARSYIPKDLSDAVCEASNWQYPVLLKSRTGTSSRHVHFCHSEADISRWYEITPMPMLQQVLELPADQLNSEYTCSIFKAKDGQIWGPFTARRNLRSGHSHVVEVGDFKELHPLLLAIAKKMEIVGSLNVQLILGTDGPVPFELNARFSGTTSIRAYFGFNEPEMALRSYIFEETMLTPAIRKGLSLRFDEQVFLDGFSANDLANLKGPFPTGKVPSWF